MTIDEAIAEVEKLLPKDVRKTQSVETFEVAIRRMYHRVLLECGYDGITYTVRQYMAAATLDGAQQMGSRIPQSIHVLAERIRAYWKEHVRAPEWRKVERPEDLAGRIVQITAITADHLVLVPRGGESDRHIRARIGYKDFEHHSQLSFEEHVSGE